MTYVVNHWIGNHSVSKSSDRMHDIFDPALGEVVGRVYFADEALVHDAINAAKEAFPSWSATTPVKRARILFNFRELLIKHQDELAQLVTREHGKTLEDARGSVARGIEVVEHHCTLITQLQGQFSADVASHVDCVTIRQPLGVCVGISPFNFPVMVPIWMMIPAIAAGNTFIIKPSEQDPSPVFRLIELLYEAGLPKGVVNCIHGDKDTVTQLITHPEVKAVTAVASTPVAEAIYKTAISHGKRAHTFGGAKNHCVIMPDADIRQAAMALVGAAFGSAGERCMAISAVVCVGEQTKNKFIDEITPLINQMNIGRGDDATVDMGPVINARHRESILKAVDKGIEEGARLLIDGRHYKNAQYPQGFFIGPCLFDKVTKEMSIYQNELFGPVLVVLTVADFEEALALVNEHPYGNGTAIFTKDGYVAQDYSRRVQVGMVGINLPIPVPVASHPFGGWKLSSFGDHGMHGLESIHFYTRQKSITSRWLATDLANNTFSMPVNE